MSDPRPQATLFYSHKRDEHRGSFVASCAECQHRWALLLAESRKAAGIAA